MRQLLRFAITVLAFISILSGPLDMSLASQHSQLSASGQRAFEDLARCLNSKDTLDVFYLVDESGSLQDTDSEDKRAQILGSSLRELAKLRSGLTVNYAVGFFAERYSTWQTWKTLNAANVDENVRKLEVEVARRDQGAATDWLVATESALQELRQQRAKSKGCQVLIWLTDGAIDTSKANYSEAEALAELCERTFNSLRQSKVTVLGVLLKSDKDLQRLEKEVRDDVLTRMSFMGPIVEGSGDIGVAPETQSLFCGESPVPANFAAGALLVAENPISLSYQFLRLSSLLSGGTRSSISSGNPGKFLVEEGVARFRIITTSKRWTLTGPDGRQYTANSGLDVLSSGGATQITLPVTEAMLGTWKFGYETDSSNELILFSGLSLRLDEGELIAGMSGTISGTVVSEFGNQAVKLSLYGSSTVTVQEVLGDGTVGPKRRASFIDSSRFSLVDFTPSPDQGQVEIRVVLQISTKSGIALAPVSAARSLVVRLPSNYPSLSNSPIQFAPIKGLRGEGQGELIFKGPLSGSGKVCLGQPQILSDSIDRTESFKWSSNSADLINGCLSLSQNEEKRVSILVSNEVPANAEVIAELPVTYFSDSEGREYTLNAPLTIPTETSPLGSLVAIVLTLLGFFLPMLAIFLMTLLTTKIALGSSMQRGQWDIRVDSLKGVVDRNGETIRPTSEDFKFISDVPDSRNFSDAFGEVKAKVSRLVFPSPWFEMHASESSRLITMVAGPARAIKRFDTGKMAPVLGNVDNLWAIAVRDEDLITLEGKTSIPAQLVIFKRNNVANKNQYMERFLQVSTTPGIWGQIASLAQKVSAERASEKLDSTSTLTVVSPNSPPSPPGMPPAPPSTGSLGSFGIAGLQPPSAPGNPPAPPPGVSGGLPPKPPGA